MLKAILIDGIPPGLSKDEAEYRLLEAESLIKTYGGVVLIKKIQKKQTPDYRTYIGRGKIDEILEENKKLKANILIINNELKPQQTYNLEELLRPHQLQVWDRIDLILKIFQKHAETREAKLEIELASIKHMGPRIYGMGMQLTRQGGGIGTKGVGETNLEFMKRHLAKAEQRIQKELEAYKKVRKLHRNSRKRKEFKTVGIIGYTNAGKTSLLNALTGKGAYAANKLFATLDTRVGKMFFNPTTTEEFSKLGFYNEANQNQISRIDEYVESNFEATDKVNSNFQNSSKPEILISDTIGFIQNLPTTLIKSFQSTLEETIDADLLLHVIDINDAKVLSKIKIVNEILAQIDALHKPTFYVFNKIDLLKLKGKKAKLKKFEQTFQEHHPLFISTEKKEGIQKLKSAITSFFAET